MNNDKKGWLINDCLTCIPTNGEEWLNSIKNENEK
jgi:hypothetical protein